MPRRVKEGTKPSNGEADEPHDCPCRACSSQCSHRSRGSVLSGFGGGQPSRHKSWEARGRSIRAWKNGNVTCLRASKSRSGAPSRRSERGSSVPKLARTSWDRLQDYAGWRCRHCHPGRLRRWTGGRVGWTTEQTNRQAGTDGRTLAPRANGKR